MLKTMPSDFDVQLLTNSPDPDRSRYFYLGNLKSSLFNGMNNVPVGGSFRIKYIPVDYTIDYAKPDFDKSYISKVKTVDLINIVSASRIPVKTFLLDLSYKESLIFFRTMVEDGVAKEDPSLFSNKNVLQDLDDVVKNSLETGELEELIKEMNQYNSLSYLMYRIKNNYYL